MSNRTRFFRPATAVGAMALVLLTACSGGGNGGSTGDGSTGDGSTGDGVASIASPGASGTKASADPDAGRPRIRLDSTQEEISRMEEAWVACVDKTLGYKRSASGKGVSSPAWLKVKTNPADPNGPAKACISKLPVDPPELSPATNPDYADGLRVFVKCMRSHNIDVRVYGDAWGMPDGAQMSTPNFTKYQPICQVKAWTKN